MAPKKAKSKSPKAAVAVVKKRKSKADKKKGPKRPMTAFLLFSNDRRKEIVAKNPELKSKIGDVAKKIGAEWHQLGQDKKKKYDDMAAKDRVRYESEKAKFK